MDRSKSSWVLAWYLEEEHVHEALTALSIDQSDHVAISRSPCIANKADSHGSPNSTPQGTQQHGPSAYHVVSGTVGTMAD
jgi:hypothetical protein